MTVYVSSKSPAISLENVSFQYPGAQRPSVSNINLDIKVGELVVLTGGSGCGKTTITRIVNGLAEKFYEGTLSGSVKLFGRPLSEYPFYEIGACVGSIFQDPRSQFFASVTEDEVAFGCENYGVPFEKLGARVAAAVKSINGQALLGKEIYPMSSGEKQKIAVASVSAVNPKIYVFDEPSANLDMFSVEALKTLMHALKENGHTILVAEHRLYYLTDLADRFLYMEDGRLAKEWSRETLLQLSEQERKAMGLRALDLGRIETAPPVKIGCAETLAVQDVTFSYHKRLVFENLSFTTYSGDIIAVIGHNGVGKTTLSHILCGLKKEAHGQVLYREKTIARKKRKDVVYFVMQNTDCQLFADSVAEELKLNGKNTDEEQIEKLLKLYGLYEWRDCHPATLSGGQKQRLTLAVSDQIDAPVLILDEPTSGLDFRNMARISKHLRTLAEEGKTVLIITHDFEFAAMTCNRVLHFLDGGQIEDFSLQGNLDKLYACMMAQ